jgi:hypothetical protein
MGLGSGLRDPRSGMRKKPIPDPGSRGQKGTGSRIRNIGLRHDEPALQLVTPALLGPVVSNDVPLLASLNLLQHQVPCTPAGADHQRKPQCRCLTHKPVHIVLPGHHELL